MNDDVMRAKESWEDHLFQYRDVSAVGVGIRWRGGEPTDEIVVTVAVLRKRPEEYIATGHVIPRTLDVDGRQVGTDVVEGGPFYAGGTPEFDPPGPTITKRFKNLKSGAQISNKITSSYGTMTCIVRDKRDKSLCILSNNHVLVVGNRGGKGRRRIEHPYNGETVARLKRFVKYKPLLKGSNKVDAAIAELKDPDRASRKIAGNRMSPISRHHKALGIFFASDPTHGLGFICRMGPVLKELDIELLTKKSVHHPRAESFKNHIEKVGTRTGYSSSKIWGINFTIVVTMHGPKGRRLYKFTDQIATWRFGWPGDSGSLVCMGGDGNTLLPLEVPKFCRFLKSVGRKYDLPTRRDRKLIGRFRDNVLTQSGTGMLLTQTLYANMGPIVKRVNKANVSKSDKAYARTYYRKYRKLMRRLVRHPHAKNVRIRSEYMNDLSIIVSGLSEHMTKRERRAYRQLRRRVLNRVEGKSYRRATKYFNRKRVYRRTLRIMKRVPTIDIPGKIHGNDGSE